MRLLITLLIIVLNSSLYSQFIIHENFDDYADWKTQLGGNPLGDVFEPGDMPKKQNGESTIWEYYSYWGSVPAQSRPEWIKNHGSENVYKGEGKSLRIDYSGSGTGPSRLAMHIGNSPSNGYNEIYLFYMIKINLTFFPMSGNSFRWFGYLKTLQLDAGFRDVWNWGTVDEQNKLPANNDQLRHVYGLTDVTMNWMPIGGYLVFQYNASRPNSTGTGWAYYLDTEPGNDASIGELIKNGEWFGIEYRFKLSDPHGANNGIIEIWTYSNNGIVAGHDVKSGLVTMSDASNHVFNHKINKIVFGGNRYDPDFQNCESHYFIDEVILDTSRIGLRFFEGAEPEQKNKLSIRLKD